MRFLVVLAVLILGLGGCSRSQKYLQENPEQASLASSGSADSGNANAEVDAQELSTLRDQKTIEELRKDVPPEIRKENDAIKETLNLMGDGTEEPQRIRDRFQRIIRKMQETFNKTERRLRDDFSKNERKNRESFLKDQEKARKEFRKGKADREKSKEFYDELNLKQKDFFAEQREKRNEFESSQREKNNDFRAMIRERNRDFDLEYRNYVKRFNDARIEKEKARREGRSSVTLPGATPGGASAPTTTYEPLQSGKKPGQ